MNLMKEVSCQRLIQVEILGALALSFRVLLYCMGLLILLPSAHAQELPTKGIEHEYLKRLVGTWDAETEFGKGTMTYKMGWMDCGWLVTLMANLAA
jgi:hypothetical protein